MTLSAEDLVVRAYVKYAGVPRFNEKKFAGFLGKYPKISQMMSRAQLRSLITKGAAAHIDMLDPILNIEALNAWIPTPNRETKAFLEMAPRRLQAFVDHFKRFAFQDNKNKIQLKNAILTVYGADPSAEPAATPNPAGDPNAMGDPADHLAEDMNATSDNQLPPIAGEPGALPDNQGLDAMGPATGEPGAPSEITPGDDEQIGTLPPELEEQATSALSKYLQKDVFQNKLIPVVKISEAWKLQDGYVVKFEMSSMDDSVKAYTVGTIYNDTLILPAEIRDSEDKVLGEFNHEVLQKTFAEVGGKSETKSENYQNLMDQMVSTPDAKAASKILDHIISRFGSYIGKQAFDSYVRITGKSYEDVEKLGAASRLDVKIGTPVTQDAILYDDLADNQEKEDEKLLNEITKNKRTRNMRNDFKK